jgi:hypothetical protein
LTHLLPPSTDIASTLAPPPRTPIRWRPREQQALDELANTQFAPGIRFALIAFFLSIITIVPIVESLLDYRANVQKRNRMLAAGAPRVDIPGRRPRAFGLFYLLPTARMIMSAHTLDQWRQLMPQPRQLRGYENDLLYHSAVGKMVRPWVQRVLTNWLGTGSQKVQIGRDGWLFYSDGVQYVAGAGFLDPAHLAARSADGVVGDPRPAIFQLNDELRALGVTLLLLPVPDKAVVRPASLSGIAPDAPLQNKSWELFAAELRSRGVLYVDLAPEMFKAEQAGTSQFFQGDSHWSSAGIEVAARLVSRAIAGQLRTTSVGAPRYERRRTSVTHANDLIALLDLETSHAGRVQFLEPAETNQVTETSGALWASDSTSDILFIGDSYLETMSDAAGGLAEQVSYNLQRPVERRAGHVFGPLLSREWLGQSLSDVRRNVAGRRLVVWEFAMRNLAVESWPTFAP